jgi:hypothetical protein
LGVAVDPEQGLADCGPEADVRGGLLAQTLADGDDQCSQQCGDIIRIGGRLASKYVLVLSAASPARRAMPVGGNPVKVSAAGEFPGFSE